MNCTEMVVTDAKLIMMISSFVVMSRESEGDAIHRTN